MNGPAARPQIIVDVWSDYVCPFCYLQVPALARLQAAFGERIKISWRAFELRPEPVPTLDPAGEYLTTAWERSVYPMALERGMTLRLPPLQPRSRLAHQAMQFAAAQDDAMQTGGAQDGGTLAGAMNEALFRAFFEDGRDIGDPAVLCAIGAESGLDAGALRAALDSGAGLAQVLDDERLARDLGISGVPFMALRAGAGSWREAVPLQGAVSYEPMHTAVARLLEPGPR